MLQAFHNKLAASFEGEIFTDQLHLLAYATDASIYREVPQMVLLPKSEIDLGRIVALAHEYDIALIPRGAGTSLAGQCVGNAVVVDVSLLNKIIDFDPRAKYITVQPGLVRDELNAYLKEHGLFFSPITSTANRAMIGGMVGNNSSGTTSIKYGCTRDKVIGIKGYLSDGSMVYFGPHYPIEYQTNPMAQKIKQEIIQLLSHAEVQSHIHKDYPHPSIKRRNTGYALDELLQMNPFNPNGPEFDLCKLLAGSEGTLMIFCEITLQLDDLPPPIEVVIAAHFESINSSMKATQHVMDFEPYACELMDKVILDCTKSNMEHKKNRWFVEGDPAAILMIECRGESLAEATRVAEQIVSRLRKHNLGYSYPIISGDDTKKVWQLRSAGLGLLANIKSEKKALACIEDTAVTLADLPNYIEDFEALMTSYGQQAVYYAHAGAGEIHLRPILDLKTEEGVQMLQDISRDVALLVKKYKGSLSGEHGDGRVRAPFIPLVLGHKNYETLQVIKAIWDPKHLLNPGKIVHFKPMVEDLRVSVGQKSKAVSTVFDFEEGGTMLDAASKCNGSGDCRKLSFSGGTMCPSYHASRREKDTTRARANLLREYLTHSTKVNPLDHQELKEVMDLCISCKGCTAECPSNVDMASLKSEFQFQYYLSNKRPWRDYFVLYNYNLLKLGQLLPKVTNYLLGSSILSSMIGFSKQRSLPQVNKTSLKKWVDKNYPKLCPPDGRRVWILCDEFMDVQDEQVGQATFLLLWKLGYDAQIPPHVASGRAAISKGFLKQAKNLAQENIKLLHPIITEHSPIIGIEPSAILTLRDEYPRLVPSSEANSLANNTYTLDEFLSMEVDQGNIGPQHFHEQAHHIVVHGHCHQKALSDQKHTLKLLSLPSKYTTEMLQTGCCGMAGSFGYEAEHYDFSIKIAEIGLFPKLRAQREKTIICASGTSCRHQIKDGLNRRAFHLAEILHAATIT